MKTYICSYITKNGVTCLNVAINANSRTEAIDEMLKSDRPSTLYYKFLPLFIKMSRNSVTSTSFIENNDYF